MTMSESLPPQVYTMLRNARFLHLATCKDNIPSASLMNFILIEPEETFTGSDRPLVVLATPANTQKFDNIQSNHNVSLLVHDYVASSAAGNLAQYLQKLNEAELSRSSVTVSGHARVAEGKEAEHYRGKLLSRHEDASCFIRDHEIVIIDLQHAKLADASNNVKAY